MVGKLWISAFSWYFQKKNIDPTGRQNFGDAPGQIPKLILTLCHNILALLLQKSQYTRIQILYIIEEFPYIIEKICTLHYLARTGIGPLI